MDGFALEERIGVGPRSEVYRATQLSSGRTVALKLSSHPGHLRREANCLRNLDDPGIVSLVAEGSDWIALELVEGPSVQQMLDEGTLPPLAERVRLVATLARTLGRLHARGIVHRDVKPSNILVGQTGPRLADFGIAIAPGEPASDDVVGTPRYMAPEQSALAVSEWPRVDQHATGTVLAELAAAPAEVEASRLADLLAIAGRARAAAPAHRFESMSALADALDGWGAGRSYAPPSRTRTLLGLSVGALLLGGGIAWVLMAQHAETTRQATRAQRGWLELAMKHHQNSDATAELAALANIDASREPTVTAGALAALARVYARDQNWAELEALLAWPGSAVMSTSERDAATLALAMARADLEAIASRLEADEAHLLAPFRNAELTPPGTQSVHLKGDFMLYSPESLEGFDRAGAGWLFSLEHEVPSRGEAVRARATVGKDEYVVTRNNPRRLARWDGRALHSAHAATDALDAYVTSLDAGDLDGDGDAELVAGLGPSDGFLIRVYAPTGHDTEPLRVLADTRPGFVAGARVDAGLIVAVISHENPNARIFGREDPYGGPCRLAAYRLEATGLVEVDQVAWATGRCPLGPLHLADLDGNGTNELAVEMEDGGTEFIHRHPDGRLDPFLTLPGWRVAQAFNTPTDVASELLLVSTRDEGVAYLVGGETAGRLPGASWAPLAGPGDPFVQLRASLASGAASVAGLRATAAPSAALDLGRPLPPALERPVPVALRQDAEAGTLQLRLAAGVGTVLRWPLRATGAPVWMHVAGTWTRGEWGSSARIKLRRAADADKPSIGLNFVTTGAGDVHFRWIDLAPSVPAAGPRSLRIPSPLDRREVIHAGVPTVFDVHAGMLGDDGLAHTAGWLGGRDVLAEQGEVAPPVPGESWTLEIEAADWWGAGPGHLAELVLSRLDLGGLAPDLEAPGRGDAPDIASASPEQLAGLVRLDATAYERAREARSLTEADQAWATGVLAAAKPHRGDPEFIDLLLAAPSLRTLDDAGQDALAIEQGDALLRTGRHDEARARLHRAWQGAEARGVLAWRDAFDAACLLATLAQDLGQQAEAEAWRARALEVVPDADLGPRLLRHRSPASPLR